LKNVRYSDKESAPPRGLFFYGGGKIVTLLSGKCKARRGGILGDVWLNFEDRHELLAPGKGEKKNADPTLTTKKTWRGGGTGGRNRKGRERRGVCQKRPHRDSKQIGEKNTGTGRRWTTFKGSGLEDDKSPAGEGGG